MIAVEDLRRPAGAPLGLYAESISTAIDSPQLSTYRLNQSITAIRYTNPCTRRMYVISVLHRQAPLRHSPLVCATRPVEPKRGAPCRKHGAFEALTGGCPLKAGHYSCPSAGCLLVLPRLARCRIWVASGVAEFVGLVATCPAKLSSLRINRRIQIVALDVAGSNPVTHSNLSNKGHYRCAAYGGRRLDSASALRLSEEFPRPRWSDGALDARDTLMLRSASLNPRSPSGKWPRS